MQKYWLEKDEIANGDVDTVDDELTGLITHSLQDTLRAAAIAWTKRNRHIAEPELVTALIAGSTGFLAHSLARLLAPLPNRAVLLELSLTMIRDIVELEISGAHGRAE